MSLLVGSKINDYIIGVSKNEISLLLVKVLKSALYGQKSMNTWHVLRYPEKGTLTADGSEGEHAIVRRAAHAMTHSFNGLQLTNNV